MKIIKLFSTSVDICDVEKLYQPITTLLMDELKSKYEKRCFKSSYIIEIKEIIHYSQCEISTDHQQCIGKVDLMFTALVEIYTTGNIIPVCELEVRRNNGEFIAQSEDAKIQLIPDLDDGPDKLLPAFKVGDRFPIRVKEVTYGPHQRKMTVIGHLPRIQPDPLVIYKINTKEQIFTDYHLKLIEDFVTKNDRTKWITSLEPADKKKYDEYIAVTYPYKENKTPQIPKTSQFNFMNIDDLKKINAEFTSKDPFYICYPPEISRSKPIAYIMSSNAIEQYKNHIYDENPMVVITGWITTHYNYVEFVKSLTENYPSPTTDRYRALWGMIHLKKEA